MAWQMRAEAGSQGCRKLPARISSVTSETTIIVCLISGNFIFNPFPSLAHDLLFPHRRDHCTMPRGRVSWQLLCLSVVVCLMLIAQRISAQKESSESSVDVAQMSILEIEDALQVCVHPSIVFHLFFL